MAVVATRKGEWGLGYAGMRLEGGSCGFGGGALGECLGSEDWIFEGFAKLELKECGLGGSGQWAEGNHLSVVNLFSLYAVMKAGERRKARRLRPP